MAKQLLQRVVSDAATRVAAARGNGAGDKLGSSSPSFSSPSSFMNPEIQRADTAPAADSNNGAEYREMLLRHVKREVKQLMEESVMRKCVHEESSVITSLSAGVENCLLYGLKKHSLGLFKENTSFHLLQCIAKDCDHAKVIVDRLGDAAGAGGAAVGNGNGGVSGSKELRRPAQNVKYQWIRMALLDRRLHRIVEHLIADCKQMYEADSIIADACDGPLLASLLAGPCALDYTKVKTLDHIFSDPSADELLQRHRIHSPIGSPGAARVARAPSLKTELNWLRRQSNLLSPNDKLSQIKRHASSSSEDSGTRSAPSSAKEFVELLHQNNRTALLFGKNNVLSQSASLSKRVPGYLSLHQANSVQQQQQQQHHKPGLEGS